jgi:hypothetical protein
VVSYNIIIAGGGKNHYFHFIHFMGTIIMQNSQGRINSIHVHTEKMQADNIPQHPSSTITCCNMAREKKNDKNSALS